MQIEGFFDLATLTRHFDENAVVVLRWRQAARPIRILIDAVRLMPHSPEGQACVQNATARIYRPGDKVAVLVASGLVKMQMKRALSHGDVIDFFIVEKEALAWLGVT
jgi:hypothetical protein